MSDFSELKHSEDSTVELRCPGTLQGVLKEIDGQMLLEIKCHHNRCVRGRAVDVFHYYDPQTMDGKPVDTREFKKSPLKGTG